MSSLSYSPVVSFIPERGHTPHTLPYHICRLVYMRARTYTTHVTIHHAYTDIERTTLYESEELHHTYEQTSTYTDRAKARSYQIDLSSLQVYESSIKKCLVYSKASESAAPRDEGQGNREE